MAGIVATTSPCVQVVETYVSYYYNLPPLPSLPQDPSSDPAFPFTSRNVIVLKLLILCPGIWESSITSFTYTNGYGETFSMTIRDINNVFPLQVPPNESIEVEVAWDFFADSAIIVASPDYQGQGNPYGDGFFDDVLAFVETDSLNFCIDLVRIYVEEPPPEEGEEPGTFPGAGGISPDDLPDPGAGTDLPEEDTPSGESGGADSESGSTGDEGEGADSTGGYDEGGHGTNPHAMPPNMPSAEMYKLKKLQIDGKILGDFKDRVRKPGTRGPMNKADLSTNKKPVAGIGEPREIYFTQLHNKSALKQNSFGLGQAFVPRVKNNNAVNELVYAPNRSQIVGKKTTVKPTTTTDKTAGNRITISSTKSNPTVDISTKELHGSDASVTNFNAYVTKDPKAGSRLEKMPKYNYRSDNKVDAQGRPIKTNASRKDGAASVASKAGFNLFATNIPKDKVFGFISRKNTRQLAQTSGNEDYQIPLAHGEFTIVDDSNIIYNGGQGLFYGFAPFPTIESDEFLEGIHTLNPTKDLMRTFVTVNDSSIASPDFVVPASVGIQNSSFHQKIHGAVLLLGILDSENVFRYIGYNYINIPPRSYQFMTAPIPAGLPVGAAKVIGMLFNSNNELILSEKEDIVIASDGFTVEGYTPYSPMLPATLANLANNPNALHQGRVHDVIDKRRYKATSDTVDVVTKIPQISVNGGLDTKITAIDISSTGSSSSRYTIDGVEIFVGSHDAYLQFNTTSGNNVDILIADAENKSNAVYLYTVFGSNLEFPDLVFSGIANGTGYIGGNIQTNVLNGKVLLENDRTDLQATVYTTHDGYLILNTDSGWNQTGDVITQVIASQTPYLGFSSLPGDTLNIYAEGVGGEYNDLIVQETLLPDNDNLLPTSTYTLPEDPSIPAPVGTPNAGDNLPPPVVIDPNPVPPGSGVDETPPGTAPNGNNGECVDPGGYQLYWEARIMSVCQRPSNPCIVDIVSHIHECDPEGNPLLSSDLLAALIPELCAFSIDSTNGIDGTWYQLHGIETDPNHMGSDAVAMPGTHVFVADMCDHFSDFFSTDTVMFRLLFNVGNNDGGFVGICTIEEILG